MGRWQGKYVIGLTGNIAMGKSSIRKMLEHLGAYTIDADGLAHQVMAPGAPAYQPIIETFGKWILDAERRVDRTKLGAVAFSHPEALQRLESLTHPIVGQGIDTLVNRAKHQVVVIEAIKLVDGVLGQQVDAVWVVDTAPQIQLERLIKRGLNEYEARKRIDTQNPQREKLAKADVVISNSGALQDTWVQVEREWNKILAARGIEQQRETVINIPVRQPAQPPQAVPPTPTKTATGTVPQMPAGLAKTATGTVPTVPDQPVAPQSRPPMPPVSPKIATGANAGVTQPLPPPAKITTGSAPQVPVTPRTTGVNPAIQPLPRSTGTLPAVPPTPPAPVPAPVPEPVTLTMQIKRGMPSNAEMIAKIINQATGKALTRIDVMMAFGEKSYLLAEVNGNPVGLAGFQVENLITRMDEFFFTAGAPVDVLTEPLLQAVEEKSKELQSEVGFMFLPNDAPASVAKVFQEQGYIRMDVEAIKVPAWREAAEEAQPPNTQIWAKKLRAERVLKPL